MIFGSILVGLFLLILAVAIFRKRKHRCKGCNSELYDPNLCWCGDEKKNHNQWSNHGFVPWGCNCHRAK